LADQSFAQLCAKQEKLLERFAEFQKQIAPLLKEKSKNSPKGKKTDDVNKKPDGGAKKVNAGAKKPEIGDKKPDSGSKKPENVGKKRENDDKKPDDGGKTKKAKPDVSPTQDVTNKPTSSRTPNAAPLLEKFNLELTCTSLDQKWLVKLSKLASKYGVQVGSKPSGQKTISIKTEGDIVKLSGQPLNEPVLGRVGVWETLGSVLIGPTKTVQEWQWLQLADDLLTSKTDLDAAYRQINRQLASRDFLCGGSAAQLVDFLWSGLLAADQSYVASNTELWLQRVDASF